MNIPKELRRAYLNDLTDCPILLDGADEIDRLAAEVERLRGALKTAKHYMLNCGVNIERDYPEIVAALEAKP